MPDAPDFEQIARDLATRLGFNVVSGYGSPFDTLHAALVKAWNARGVADRDLVAGAADVDGTLTALEVQGLRNDIRSLDR